MGGQLDELLASLALVAMSVYYLCFSFYCFIVFCLLQWQI